jgi:uncharacterized membrane protein YoaK (UPF0700 family)
MTRDDKRVRGVAIVLSGLAGYVDAIGFIKLGGFFVSFMSGNSTRLAVGIAQGTMNGAIAASLIGLLTGATLGALLYPDLGPGALWLAAAITGVAACVAVKLGPP